MKRQDVLGLAQEAVCRDRNATYGEPEENFTKVARLWGATFGWHVEPYQVGLAMALLKIARIESGQNTHADSFVDGCGYLAVAGEVVDAS